MTNTLNYKPDQTLADTLEEMGKIDYIGDYAAIRQRAHLEQAIMVAKLARSLTFPIRLLARLIGDWLKSSKLRYELESLDDRMLADMGISRYDIQSIVSGGKIRPQYEEVPQNLVFFKAETASDETVKATTEQRNAA